MALRAVSASASGVDVTSIAGTANQITASAATGAVTLSRPAAVTEPGSVTVTGAAAGAFSTTGVGIRIKGAALTRTDSTTGAGTIATTAGDYFSAITFATAANAITVTDAYGSYHVDPVASTNVTFTRKWALGADSLSIGTSGVFRVSTAGVLTTTGAQLTTPTIGAASATSVTFTAAATGIVLKQGANGLCGTFVCNGTSAVTVSNTNVAITDAIVISLNAVGGTVGAIPHVDTITAATGFTTKGTASDTSTYNYAIIKNAA